MEENSAPSKLPITAQNYPSTSSVSSEDNLSRNSSSDDITIIIHPESEQPQTRPGDAINSHKHAELNNDIPTGQSQSDEVIECKSSTSSAPSSSPPMGDEDDMSSDTDSDDLSSSEDEDELNESLSTTIIQEIQDGVYTCLVCTCEIDQSSTIWSCDTCYRVYDLDCIKDWAIRGSSTNKDKKTWRCPSCNIEHDRIPKKFTCWCGRVTNPNSNSLIPFSCGNTCNSKYDTCIHSCGSICHPGQHPVCGAMGPLMKCKCGKSERQLPCLITPYEEGWQCDSPCDVELCDLGHTCPQKSCHSGLCGQCTEVVKTKCYCGSHELDVRCQDRLPKQCFDEDSGKEFIGGTSCDDTVILHYDCQQHFEEMTCQPLPPKAPVCKFSPDKVKTCYCGKTSVDNFNRTKCTDPMPECDSVCGKLLKCGCTCLNKCHPGECICYNIIDAKCACENSSFLVPCSFLQESGQPRCTHKCPVLLNCRRHYHRAVCCPSEQAALRREREKKKQIRNRTRSNFDDELMSIEPIHICTRTCNRLKSCGTHYCEAMCHNGPCGVCLESSNEDLICNCGRTVIPAPVRCGTVLDCSYQCVRPKTCGHPPETHTCHGDDKPCPKCTKLVTKACNCGLRTNIPNVLCSQESVSCGKICNVPKSCGHPCLRVCSRDCVEGRHADTSSCQAICHKVRSNCPHFCKLRCHVSKKGTCDSVTCKEMVTITCGCGHKTKKVSCGGSSNDKTKIGTTFECDDECTQVQREAELKAAFGVEAGSAVDTTADFVNPYNSAISEVFKRQATWCKKWEMHIRDFISDYEDQVASGMDQKDIVKSFHFPVMTKPQRSFIHNLAAVYKLYSESQDREPQRSIFIAITDLTKVPQLTIERTLLLQDEIDLKRSQAQQFEQLELNDAYFNAIVIQDVFFGIVKEDVEANVAKVLEAYKNRDQVESPTVSWMKESTYILYDKSNYKSMDVEKENVLYTLMKSCKSKLRDNLVAFDCKLCMINEEADSILKVDEKNIITQRADFYNVTSGADKSSNSFDILNVE